MNYCRTHRRKRAHLRYMIRRAFRAVFKLFCKQPTVIETVILRFSEPEAKRGHRRRRLGLVGLAVKMLR